MNIIREMTMIMTEKLCYFEVLQKGQVYSTRNWRACMISCMNVDEARGVCKDRSLQEKSVSLLVFFFNYIGVIPQSKQMQLFTSFTCSGFLSDLLTPVSSNIQPSYQGVFCSYSCPYPYAASKDLQMTAFPGYESMFTKQKI